MSLRTIMLACVTYAMLYLAPPLIAKSSYRKGLVSLTDPIFSTLDRVTDEPYMAVALST